MITGRRAAQFHALVEEGSTSSAALPAYSDLLEVVFALRAVPAPVADPAFVTSLRDRLVAEAESVLVTAAADQDAADARLRLASSPAAARSRRLAAVVSGVVLVGGTATMAVASQSALPGDGLYPVKRGLENAHVELTFDRGDRGRLLLADARTRLDEAQTLSRTHADPARVDDALDAFTAQAISGSDLLVSDYDATGDRSSVTALRTFSATSMDRLDELQSEVPAQSLGPLLHAAQTVDQVHQTAIQTCAVCDGPTLGSIPSVLARSTQATLDAWQLAVPRRPHQHLAKGDDGTLVLPHLQGQLPPASVTDPGDSTAVTPPITDTAPTAGDVQHTVRHLTDGLTHDQQNDVASTVADTADNLLDAVGEVGNQVAQQLGNTVGGITSLLPTLPTLPSLP